MVKSAHSSKRLGSPLPTDSRWGTEQRRTAHQMSKAAVFAATLSTLVLSAAPAPAAEIKVTKRVGDVGHIEISGPIGPADDVTFEQIESKEHFSHATVYLNSLGGMVDPAIRIGQAIRAAEWTTSVEWGDTCASACVIIWAGGFNRYLVGRLGLHSAATRISENPPKYIRSEIGNAKIAAYFKKMGMPQELIDLWPKADPDRLNFVTYGDFNNPHEAANPGLSAATVAIFADVFSNIFKDLPKIKGKCKDTVPNVGTIKLPDKFIGTWCIVDNPNCNDPLIPPSRRWNRIIRPNVIEVTVDGADPSSLHLRRWTRVGSSVHVEMTCEDEEGTRWSLTESWTLEGGRLMIRFKQFPPMTFVPREKFPKLNRLTPKGE
jgi:hypothetical protein